VLIPSQITHVLRKWVINLKWAGILKVYLSVYLDLQLGGALQLKSQSNIVHTSTIFAISILLFNTGVLLFFYKLTKKYLRERRMSKDDVKKRWFYPLFEEYKHNSRASSWMNIFLILFRFFFGIFLSYLNPVPLPQVVCVLVIQILIMLFVLIVQPYETKSDKVMTSVSEICYFVAICLILAIQQTPLDRNSEIRKANLAGVFVVVYLINKGEWIFLA
jgi:hypothetical protein